MNISRASTYDYVALNAHIRAIYKDRYNCDADIERVRKRAGKHKPEVIEGMVSQRKAAKGCGIVLARTVDRIDNIQYNTCLCSIKHPLTNRLMQLSELLDKGILPFNGPAMEQPAQVMDLLDIVGRAKSREQNEIRKEKADGRSKHRH